MSSIRSNVKKVAIFAIIAVATIMVIITPIFSVLLPLGGLLGGSLIQGGSSSLCDTTGGVNLAPVAYSSGQKVPALQASQRKNAEIAIGVALGHTELTPALRRKLAIIVYIIARVESDFVNVKTRLNFTSLGMIQQQDWWGTEAQRTDVAQSIELLISGGAILPRMFNGRADGSEPGILDVKGWQNMSPGDVAADVQRPDARFRGKYAAHVAEAEAFLGGNLPMPSGDTYASPIVSDDTCITAIQLPGGKANLVNAAVADIKKYVGVPYSWGGETLEEGGFDCSGLIYRAYQDVGIKTTRLTANGLYKSQVPIPNPRPETLQPGDLLYRGGATKTHVMMYLGGNKVIQALKTGTVIKITTLRWDGSLSATRLPEGYTSVAVTSPAGASSMWRAPLDGRLVANSAWGERFHPILERWRLHDGIDFAVPTGTPVYAMSDARVTAAGYSGGSGNRVTLDYGGGLISSSMHLSRIAVQEGQQVSKGTVIGYVGTTGLSTGPHLHLLIHKDGEPVDPYPILTAHGLTVSGKVHR